MAGAMKYAPEVSAFLEVMRAEEHLRAGLVDLLRPRSLSPAQYNVLRILRGAGKQGLRCQEISERMISRGPDITRLLDRLERAGLIRRERSGLDRRVVVSALSPSGGDLLRRLDRPVQELHRRQFANLTREEALTLAGLLARVRGDRP